MSLWVGWVRVVNILRNLTICYGPAAWVLPYLPPCLPDLPGCPEYLGGEGMTGGGGSEMRSGGWGHVTFLLSFSLRCMYIWMST